MISHKSTWFGLATLGVFALGCTDDAPNDDEVGEGTTSTETATSDDETSDSGDTTESTTDTTDTTDTTTDGTDTTDESDTTDTTTGDGEFQLIEAALADDFGTLVLTFNDAVASVDAVDPSDFRISMALTIAYNYMGMRYDVSYYTDPNTYLDEYATPIGMMAIANGPGPDQISLTLEPSFDMDPCMELADALDGAPPNYMPDGHFFPHYAPGNIPVTSEGGSELAAIGPDWVLEPGNLMFLEVYGWPNLDPQIPIPCP